MTSGGGEACTATHLWPSLSGLEGTVALRRTRPFCHRRDGNSCRITGLRLDTSGFPGVVSDPSHIYLPAEEGSRVAPTPGSETGDLKWSSVDLCPLGTEELFSIRFWLDLCLESGPRLITMVSIGLEVSLKEFFCFCFGLLGLHCNCICFSTSLLDTGLTSAYLMLAKKKHI